MVGTDFNDPDSGNVQVPAHLAAEIRHSFHAWQKGLWQFRYEILIRAAMIPGNDPDRGGVSVAPMEGLVPRHTEASSSRRRSHPVASGFRNAPSQSSGADESDEDNEEGGVAIM